MKKKKEDHNVLVIARALRDIQRIANKSGLLASRFQAWKVPDSETIELTRQITEVAQRVEAQLLAIPATWKAVRGTVGQSPITEGEQIKLTDRATKRYVGIIEKGQIFTVSKIVGTKFVCVGITKEQDRITMPLPRSNVQRVES